MDWKAIYSLLIDFLLVLLSYFIPKFFYTINIEKGNINVKISLFSKICNFVVWFIAMIFLVVFLYKDTSLPIEVILSRLIISYIACTFGLIEGFKPQKRTIAKKLDIRVFPFEIKDRLGNVIYSEDSNGSWKKRVYDLDGYEIMYEDSNGQLEKTDYYSSGKQIYYKSTKGFTKTNYDKENRIVSTIVFQKNERRGYRRQLKKFDTKGNITYCEYENGEWTKFTYDENGKEIYSEEGRKRNSFFQRKVFL